MFCGRFWRRSLSSFSKLTSTSDSFLSRLRSSMLGSATWGEESSDSYVTQSREKLVHLWINQSDVLKQQTNWAARSHQQGATQTVFVSTDTFYYLQSCTQRKVFRFYCATQTRIKMFGGQEPSGSWLGDILKSNTRLITRFKNWTRCHTN